MNCYGKVFSSVVVGTVVLLVFVFGSIHAETPSLELEQSIEQVPPSEVPLAGEVKYYPLVRQGTDLLFPVPEKVDIDNFPTSIDIGTLPDTPQYKADELVVFVGKPAGGYTAHQIKSERVDGKWEYRPRPFVITDGRGHRYESGIRIGSAIIAARRSNMVCVFINEDGSVTFSPTK